MKWYILRHPISHKELKTQSAYRAFIHSFLLGYKIMDIFEDTIIKK